MNTEPFFTVPIPDYHSEANWQAFVAMFPEDERLEAPSYPHMKEMLDNIENQMGAIGVRVCRVEVNAAEWRSWVEEGNYPLRKASVPEYARQKFNEHAAHEGS